MTRRLLAFLLTFTVGAVVGNLVIPSLAQSRKPFMITRIYNGPDNVAHSEEVEMNFTKEVSKMLPVVGAELHRGAPGRVSDWHQGPSRRYVITMSGHGELEVANGKKIPVEPGHIELIEDTTGKGHITRVIGDQDRVTLHLLIGEPGKGK
jgi:hypothetical protein